jgi:dihydrofolate synthase/folylpolyglutamate synthase
MNYEEAISFIHGTLKFGIKCGLDNIQVLLSYMGNPQNNLKFVHIAGTNGKGSTASYINNILICAGYKTGLYTSPFLETFNERIRINNNFISDEDVAKSTAFIYENIKRMVNDGYNHPTEFEIVTALGFKYFSDNNCDIVVLEVGLGGRFDATNIITKPEVSVITTISYDHMNILGNTLSEIAFEKSGIIKESVPLVLYPQCDEVKKVILKKCEDSRSQCFHVNQENLRINKYETDYQEFDYKNYKSLKISLMGDFQILNAATAVETINVLQSIGYVVSIDSIYEGLSKTKWPGRFEILSTHPLFIIDGAHNLEGATALSRTMSQHYSIYKKIFILGLLKDKDISNIINSIAPLSHSIITVKPMSDRALDNNMLAEKIKELYPMINVISAPNLSTAVKLSKSIHQDLIKNSTLALICACGSLYYIGELRKYFE